jgi:orotate phosphoribosyltransferase
LCFAREYYIVKPENVNKGEPAVEQQEILNILDLTEARMKGHFLLSSGRHAAVYIQCSRVFQHSEYAEKLCAELAKRFYKIDTVIGPAVGAVLMAYEVSRHLGSRCHNMFAEREKGVMTLRRGFSIKRGERVLVVEDVVTTGKSVREVITMCRKHGANVLGVGAFIDRTGGINPFDVSFESLVPQTFPSWLPEECPLCAKGELPLTKPGSRSGL